MSRHVMGILIGGLASFAGCEVDNRDLRPIKWTYTDMGGTDAQGDRGGESSGGTTSPTTVPSTAGSGSLTGTVSIGTSSNGLVISKETPGTCNDLNGNHVLDRKESLVKNSCFDLESDRWEPEEGVSVVWNPVDVCGSADSGSLNLSYQKSGSSLGQSSGASIQCIATTAGTTYAISASFFLQTAGSLGSLGMVYFSAAECTGKKLTGADSPTLSEVGVWSSSTVMATAPTTASSLAVRLTVGRSDWKASQAQADVLVDGILVVALP